MGHYNFGGNVGALSWCGGSSFGAALRDHVCSTVLCPYSVLWRRSWQAKLSRVQGHSYPRSTASHSHAAPNTQLIGSCSPAATPLPQEPPKVMTHHRSGFPTAAKKKQIWATFTLVVQPCNSHAAPTSLQSHPCLQNHQRVEVARSILTIATIINLAFPLQQNKAKHRSGLLLPS